MKKSLLFIFLLVLSISLIGCNSNQVETPNINSDDVVGKTEDIEISEDKVTSDFSLVDEHGLAVDANNGIYMITTAGTYYAKGKLDGGQIYVDASEAIIEIELDGVSISNSSVSPIFVKDCDTVTIKVKKDSTNYIYDKRTTDCSSTNDDTIGTAAIYVANGNLKLSGKGTLSIESNYNSGIHSKDNVSIKNCTLLIKAMNNGIKGNDQVKIEENPTIGIVCGNNGIKTSNSSVGSSKNHGTIYIYGGTITINAYGDAIDAAYAVEIGSSSDSDGNTYTPVIDIYTNKYSSYTLVSEVQTEAVLTTLAGPGRPSGPGGQGGPGGGGFNGGGFGGGSSAEKADDSAKGIKANELISITAGEIFIYTYDDGIHTNNDVLDSGVTASANIVISGGVVTIKASDDGIHADGTLTINDGTIVIAESHEGLEGKNVEINGGSITISASDDGVNASKSISVSGGLLDVTVSPNGDLDGIDSNGTITISGGIIITRGPNSEMAAPLDADGTMKMTGGTLIVIGYAPRRLTTSGVTKTTSSSGTSSGSHTVTIGDQTITYNNAYTYSGSCTVFGSATASIK